MRSAGLVAAAIAALVLCEWALEVPMLRSLFPGTAATKPLTAACFVASGAALWLLYPRRKVSRISHRSGRLLAGLTIAVAAVSLIPELPGGGMPWPIAAAFVFLGLGIFTLTLRSNAQVMAGQIAGLIAGSVAAISLMGYVYRVESLYDLGPDNAVAPLTVLLMLVLSVSVLGARPDAGVTAVVSSPHAGGRMARRMLPIIVAISLLFGWLRLWSQRRGLTPESGVALFALVSIMVFATLIWLAARWLNRLAFVAADATEDLRRANESLERRVDERTVELQEALDRVETVERHRTLFLAHMSHDLRTPLNAILGFTQTQLMGLAGPLSAEQRDQLRLIDDNGRQLLAFIDALLERVDAGSHQAELLHDERQDGPAAETGA